MNPAKDIQMHTHLFFNVCTDKETKKGKGGGGGGKEGSALNNADIWKVIEVNSR